MIETAVLICSRLKSNRLPNKALADIAGLKAIEHIWLRCSKLGVPVFTLVPEGESGKYPDPKLDGVFVTERPEADSPLHRMANFVKDNGIEWVIRVTHDDILIDAEEAENLLKVCQDHDAGYGYNPGIVQGAGVEIIRAENLIRAAELRSEPTEFVSYFVRGQHMPFPKEIAFPPRKSINRPYRLTMDYPEDLILLKILLMRLGQRASLDSICSYLDTKSSLLKINQLPEVTFYTCAYNAEKTIADTIKSVLNSQVKNFEYIILDDGSTDGTLERVAEFADALLTLHAFPSNEGLARRSNQAVAGARGSFIMRVDADDILLPGTVNKMVREFQANAKLKAVFSQYNEIDVLGNPLNMNINKSAVEARHAGCALFDLKFLNELRFRDDIRHWDGLDLHTRMKQLETPVLELENPGWLYRRLPKSLSTESPERRAELLRIIGIEARA